MHDTLLENVFAPNWVVYTFVAKLTGTIQRKTQEDDYGKRLGCL